MTNKTDRVQVSKLTRSFSGELVSEPEGAVVRVHQGQQPLKASGHPPELAMFCPFVSHLEYVPEYSISGSFSLRFSNSQTLLM